MKKKVRSKFTCMLMLLVVRARWQIWENALALRLISMHMCISHVPRISLKCRTRIEIAWIGSGTCRFMRCPQKNCLEGIEFVHQFILIITLIAYFIYTCAANLYKLNIFRKKSIFSVCSLCVIFTLDHCTIEEFLITFYDSNETRRKLAEKIQIILNRL